MKSQRIEKIRIVEIRVMNPRSRNRKTFQGIVNNIGTVGLKKPITVFRRGLENDGTRYDLVCGQGRLEAVAALGSKLIPAIVTDAPLKARYLMSLIENVARQRPPLSNLLLEVRRLKDAGDSNATIAQKLGMGHTYVDGIVHLLKRGEDRLVEQVEAGTIPLSVAAKIATANDSEIQCALSEAYEKGHLRGAKLFAVQRIIARRLRKGDSELSNASLSSMDLTQEYERQTQRHRQLVARGTIVRERLALLATALKRLTADEKFLRILKAEGLESMPAGLAVRIR
jgi:ParB family chromosome partitioning protein